MASFSTMALLSVFMCYVAFAYHHEGVHGLLSISKNPALPIQGSYKSDRKLLLISSPFVSSLRDSSSSELPSAAVPSSSTISSTPTSSNKVTAFVQRNFLILGMAVGVSFAKLFPSLGATGTMPETIISKYGVFLVFLLSGLSIELKELQDATQQFRLLFLIQGLNFLVWPFLIGYPTNTLLKHYSYYLSSGSSSTTTSLIDGILIMACLPTTINMCIFLTTAANGNIAIALYNAVVGNLLGMVVTPALLLHFFGTTSIQLPFRVMVSKLCSKVLLPVSIGQTLRTSHYAKSLYKENKKSFKLASELSLIGIAWTAFCTAFSNKVGGVGPRNVLFLFVTLFILHLSTVACFFTIFKSTMSSTTTREEVVASTFTASHKTMAFGLPLIRIIFDGNPNLASYCAPVMMIHPLQLFLGSTLLVPFFKSYISAQDSSTGDDDDDDVILEPK